MSKQTTVGLQKEYGTAYGSNGSWVIRVDGILVADSYSPYSQVKETANAVFDGLSVAGLSPRWSYHPELK